MLPNLAGSIIATAIASLRATAVERGETEIVATAIADAWNSTAEGRGEELEAALDPEFIAPEGAAEIARLFIPGPGPDATKLTESYLASYGASAEDQPELAQELTPMLEAFIEDLGRRLEDHPRFRRRLEEASATRFWGIDPLADLPAPSAETDAREWQQIARQTEAELAERLSSLFDPMDVSTQRVGPDILVSGSAEAAPLGIELKVWRASAKTISNRVAEALSQAVLFRREFPRGVQLGLLIVFVADQGSTAKSEIGEVSRRLVPLLRTSGDDAGFDRVVGACQVG
jgi:hypothetical protein